MVNPIYHTDIQLLKFVMVWGGSHKKKLSHLFIHNVMSLFCDTWSKITVLSSLCCDVQSK